MIFHEHLSSIYGGNPINSWTTRVQHIPIYQGQRGDAQKSEHQAGLAPIPNGKKRAGTPDKECRLAVGKAQAGCYRHDVQGEKAHHEIQGDPQVCGDIRSRVVAEWSKSDVPIGQSIPFSVSHGDVRVPRREKACIHPWSRGILLRNAGFHQRRRDRVYLEVDEATGRDHKWKKAYPTGGWRNASSVQGGYYRQYTTGECEQGGGECKEAQHRKEHHLSHQGQG